MLSSKVIDVGDPILVRQTNAIAVISWSQQIVKSGVIGGVIRCTILDWHRVVSVYLIVSVIMSVVNLLCSRHIKEHLRSIIIGAAVRH